MTDIHIENFYLYYLKISNPDHILISAIVEKK